MKNVSATAVGPSPTNHGAHDIEATQPYMVDVTIEGSADILFHRWDCEAIDIKAKQAKGSAGKKTDNIESYLYRDDAGMICLPGEYLRMAIIEAAKSRQDPRSPRKSAKDLYKAGIVTLTALAPLGKQYDYEHRCRAVVQRNGITRVRPAFKSGWKATVRLMIMSPEYIDRQALLDTLANAGRFVGVGDFRPTYGRFNVVSFAKVELA